MKGGEEGLRLFLQLYVQSAPLVKIPPVAPSPLSAPAALISPRRPYDPALAKKRHYFPLFGHLCLLFGYGRKRAQVYQLCDDLVTMHAAGSVVDSWWNKSEHLVQDKGRFQLLL